MGIGDLDRNANDAVLQKVVCKVDGRVRGPVTTVSCKSIAASDPGHQVSGKSRELFQNSSRYLICTDCVSHSDGKVYCSAERGDAQHRTQKLVESSVTGSPQTVFQCQIASENDSEAIESQVK